jgi:hypothetical protein
MNLGRIATLAVVACFLFEETVCAALPADSFTDCESGAGWPAGSLPGG